MIRSLAWVCFVVVVTPAWAAGERALDVDTFQFTVDPAHLVVGETVEATITIEARDDAGAPLDVAPPQLATSTGTIDVPVRTAPGVYRARFVPPKEAFPHVALVSAIVDTVSGTAVGFFSVPLWGRGATTVKTKPGSAVTVHVGADAFGPVVANAAGDALVSILVPPGPETAEAQSVDVVGNESQKTIDLGVPGFNRLALLPLDDIVSGDGSSGARLLVFVVDKNGEPLPSAKLKASAPVGTFDEGVVLLAPGMFELLWRPGPQREQQVPITVALEGEPVSHATAAVRIIAGVPASASVVSPQQALAADEGRELLVRVTVLDQGGNLLPFGTARIDVDVGRIDRILGGDVSKQVAWVFPAKLPAGADKTTATLSVRAASGVVLGEAQVVLLPGKAHTLHLAPLADVVADGSSAVPVVVTALDAAGNDVVPQGVVVTGLGGKLVAQNVDVGARRFRALFVPEPRDEEQVIELEAHLGSLATTTSVRLLPRPRAVLLLGPGVTTSTSYGADIVAVGPELSMLVRLPLFDGAVYWGGTVAMLEGLASVSRSSFVQHRAFPVLTEFAWRPLLRPDLGVHLGVVGGVITSDVTVVNQEQGLDERKIETGLGFGAVVGIGYRLGPGFLELDARIAEGGTLGSSVLDGAPPWGAGLSLGYRFGI